MAGFWETVGAIGLGIGSLFGIRSGTEEPKYTVVEQVGQLEIRHYGPRIAAEATGSGNEEAARSDGFRKVAGYIFGDNQSRTSVAMTAPVAQSRSQTISMTAPVAQSTDAQGAWRIQFFMPSKYSLSTLPVPNDPAVRLVVVPPSDYAVLTYSGFTGAERVHQQTQILQTDLVASRWQATEAPQAWFYDPPWTLPFMRRNEISVRVTKKNP
jgi:hypothetical protein